MVWLLCVCALSVCKKEKKSLCQNFSPGRFCYKHACLVEASWHIAGEVQAGWYPNEGPTNTIVMSSLSVLLGVKKCHVSFCVIVHLPSPSPLSPCPPPLLHHLWCVLDLIGSVFVMLSSGHFVLSAQFEMLTGSLPFQGENRKATMAMILKWVWHGCFFIGIAVV